MTIHREAAEHEDVWLNVDLIGTTVAGKEVVFIITDSFGAEGMYLLYPFAAVAFERMIVFVVFNVSDGGTCMLFQTANRTLAVRIVFVILFFGTVLTSAKLIVPRFVCYPFQIVRLYEGIAETALAVSCVSSVAVVRNDHVFVLMVGI